MLKLQDTFVGVCGDGREEEGPEVRVDSVDGVNREGKDDLNW